MTVGHYRVIREIGRGGQGTVYLAEDTRLSRRVALKVVSHAVLGDPAVLLRFQREAAVTAKLDHPSICTVYDAGQSDGLWYIAMRYVEGETLAGRINAARRGPDSGGRLEIRFDSTTKDQSLGARSVSTTIIEHPRKEVGKSDTTGPTTRGALHEILGLMERVARALHVAHEVGVIHRDIKPNNIMLSGEDPVILDFGLARDLSSSTLSVADSGALVGTPAYMSPEQIAGDRAAVDRRTDVYSLGVTMYECLTLRRPFDEATRDALYQAILRGDPPDPRRLNRAITAEMAVVLGTAIERDQNRRYQSALALAEDLRRIRADEPILARPPSIPTRIVKFIRRNKTPSSVAAALLLVVIALATVWWFNPGVIAVTVRDRSAQVRIDDGAAVEVPANGTHRFTVSAGPHAVEIIAVAPKTARTSASHDEVHVPRGGGVISIERFVPSADGVIQLESTPPGAHVVIVTEWGETIDVAQPTPTMFSVLAGRHSVRFTLEGFPPGEQPLDLTPGARGVSCHHTWATGSLALSTDQDGTQVEVLAARGPSNGPSIRTITLPHPEPIALPAGRYTLRTRLAEHETQSIDGDDAIEIRPGEVSRKFVWLEPWTRTVDTSVAEGEMFAVIDLDGDGVFELIAGGAHGVVALSLQGAKRFDVATQTAVTSLAEVDVEDAGASDVVVTTMGGDVILLRGDGTRRWTRTFTAPDAPVATDVHRVAVADLNGDGRPEVIVGLLSGRIEILDAVSGTTTAATPLEDPLREFIVTDVSGDKNPEIVAHVITRTPTFAVLPNSRIVTIGADGRISKTVPVSVRVERLVALDARNTSDARFALVLSTGRILGMGAGDGALFELRTPSRAFEIDGFASSVRTRDHAPVIAACSRDGVLAIARPPGGFRTSMKMTEAASRLTFTDLDADGEDELVAGSADGDLIVFGSDGSRRFASRVDGRVTAVARCQGLARAGFAVATETGELTVFTADGRKRMEAHVRRPGQLAYEDLDADGEPELIVSSSGGRLTVFAHDRSRRQVLRTRGQIACITGAQIDGRDELVCGGRFGVQRFDRAGATLATIPTAAGVDEVLATDLDDDGKTDFVIRSTQGNLDVLRPDGNPRARFRTSSPEAIVAANLGPDRRKSLLYSTLAGDLQLAFADGTTREVHRGIGFISALAVGDIDGDGKPEIVSSLAAGRFPYGLAAFRVDGTVLFSQQRLGAPIRIELRDVDGDQRPEIVAWTHGRASPITQRNEAPKPGRLSILRGDGTAVLDITQLDEESPASRIVDLNGDGIAEVVAGVRVAGLEHGIAIVALPGRRLAQWRIDGSLTAMDLADVDGDAAPDVVAVSGAGFVQANRVDGTPIFRTRVPGAPDHVRIVDFIGDASPEIVTWSDRRGATVLDRLGRLLFTTPSDNPTTVCALVEAPGRKRGDLVTGDGLGNISLWSVSRPDERLRMRDDLETAIAAARHGDEARAAPAFSTASLAWVAIDPDNAWLTRLRLEAAAMTSPSARRLAARWDHAEPDWVAGILANARWIADSPALSVTLRTIAGAEESAVDTVAASGDTGWVAVAIAKLAERAVEAARRRDPHALATLAVALWYADREADADRVATEARTRALELGGRARDEIDLALKQLRDFPSVPRPESRGTRSPR